MMGLMLMHTFFKAKVFLCASLTFIAQIVNAKSPDPVRAKNGMVVSASDFSF